MPDNEIANVIVFGIGNLNRGDDGAGIQAVRTLNRRYPALRVHEIADAPMRMLNLWKDADAVYAIDATMSGATPGSVCRVDALNEFVPQKVFRMSTHAFGLAETVAIARSLGVLPRALTVVGIEGAEFGMGAGLHPDTVAGVEKAVEMIAGELDKRLPGWRRGDVARCMK